MDRRKEIFELYDKGFSNNDWAITPLYIIDTKISSFHFLLFKNIKQITEWQKLHPNYNDPSSKQSDKYMKIVLNSMSGSTKEESDKNYDKIIKNIIKETAIDKSNFKK